MTVGLIEWAAVAVVVAFLIWILDWWVLVPLGLMVMLWGAAQLTGSW